MYLQQFEFEIIHRPGKANNNADALSRTKDIECNFLGVEIQGEENEMTPQVTSIVDPTGSAIFNKLGPAPGESDDEARDEIDRTKYEMYYHSGYAADSEEEQPTPTINSIKRSQLTLISNHSDDESNDEMAQEDEDYYSEKHAESIIDLYTDDENSNWGPNYYVDNQLLNEAWGLPENDDERQLLNEWDVWTPAWTYTTGELRHLKDQLTESRWVVANQPTKKGRFRCTPFCDTENHHMHTWCKGCEIRIDHHDRHEDVCKYGIGQGQIHPDMDPNALINDIWWTEPPSLQDESTDEDEELYTKYAAALNKIHKRHQDELSGQGTSRTIYSETYPPVNEKCFKRY